MRSVSKAKPSGKSLHTLGEMQNLKYSRSVKTEASMKKDVKDHSGKYFQNLDGGKSTIETC